MLNKLLGFGLIPLISAISPLIALPAVTSQYGASGWASLAVGQSVGALAAVACELGWNTTGPTLIARGDQSSRASAYHLCVSQRLAVFSLAGPLALIVAIAVTTEFRSVAGLAALSAASSGMSATWYYVGASAPWSAALLDSAPRILSSVLGALLILTGMPLVGMPAIQVAVSISLIFIPIWLLRGTPRVRHGGSAGARISVLWKTQGAASLSRIISTAYVVLPLTVLSAFGTTPEVARYAAADRLQKFALAGLAPATQMLQGWVPRASTQHDLWKRMRSSNQISLTVGIIGACAFWFGFDFAQQLLFGDSISVSRATTLAFAIGILIIVVSRSTGGICLVLTGQLWTMTLSVSIGAIASIGPVIAYSRANDGEALAMAIAAVEALILMAQLATLGYARRAFNRTEGKDVV